MSAVRSMCVAALVVIAVALPARVGSACSCAVFEHALAVQRFEVAFRGRVERVTVRQDDEEIVLVVLEAWKGGPGARVRVRRGRMVQMCPVPRLVRGRIYDVYVSRDAEGALRIDGCNPTRAPSADAGGARGTSSP